MQFFQHICSKHYKAQIYLISFATLLLVFASCKKDALTQDINKKNWKEMSQKEIEKSFVDILTQSNDKQINEILQELKQNPHINKAEQTDPRTIAINFKGDSIFSMYSIKAIPSYWDEESINQIEKHPTVQTNILRNKDTNGTVAIFNYFSGINGRKGQNMLVENLIKIFTEHKYEIEYYPYEKFTKQALWKVRDAASSYAAIIIMSDGFEDENGISYIATGEDWEKAKENQFYYDSWFVENEKIETGSEHKPWNKRYLSWFYKKTYNVVVPVKSMTLKNDSDPTVIYIGSCQALAREENYPNKGNIIGWNGINTLSQLHATLLFARMLTYGMSLEEAFQATSMHTEEIGYKKVEAVKRITRNIFLEGNKEIQPKYPWKDIEVSFLSPYRDNTFHKSRNIDITGKLVSSNSSAIPKNIYVKFIPLNSQPSLTIKVKVKKDGSFNRRYKLKERGVYEVAVSKYETAEGRFKIKENPFYIIYSDLFKENYALDLKEETDMIQIKEIETDTKISSVSIPIGLSKKLVIDGYEDDVYTVSSSNPSVMTASIDGLDITLKGLSKGKCRLVVTNASLGIKTEIPTEVIDSDLKNGLIAYYPLDGNAQDFSGNSNHGKMYNTTTTTDRKGEKEKALQFHGIESPSHIHVPNSPSLKIAKELTISAFIRPTNWLGKDGWGGKVPNGAHCFMAKSHDRRGFTIVYNNERIWISSYEKWVNRAPGAKHSFAIGTWFHLAYVFNHNKIGIYINGRLVKEENNTEPSFSVTNQQDLYFGKFSDQWFPMNASLDNVRIYNRALSLEEIQQLSVE